MTEIEEDTNSIISIESSGENALFGKYEIGRLLGCGAFAKVYFARNIQTGQSVAIKAISKHKILKEGLMAHIKREISIMRRLRHPYIVKLYEVLATKTKIYFVMEFAKGGELYAKIAKCRFSEDLSRRYFQQLISALEYCHSHGVTHRDLKPENLLLDERGDLRVSDFGLSAVPSQIRSDQMLHTFCGTPMYVAPEILAKKGYHGAKADVWSSGIILYVLNAGYLPFNDRNLMALYNKIARGEFRCPRWMSPDLKRFLSRLLDVNPETRISVDEIVRDPWFNKGYKSIKSHVDSYMTGAAIEKSNKEHGTSGADFLNAFDIISFSSGYDLSGLFNDFDGTSDVERFISAEDPERILMVVEDVAMRENLAVTRKGWKMMVEGQNGKKHMGLQIHRLTESLAMVDVRSSDGFWREKFKPELKDMVYHPDSANSGN